MTAPSIAVIGESLIDLIRQPSGDFRPHLGGSPYNVARAIARQGVPVSYLSPLSTDRFGVALHDALVAEGVQLGNGPRSSRPTSLAVVSVDEQGQPSYALYREGIADRDVSADALLERIPSATRLLHTGSLALVPGEASKMQQVMSVARERGIAVAVDVNLRPAVEPNLDAYVASVQDLLPFCDLIKASDEDLAALGLGDDAEQAAREVARRFPLALVALTRGAHGATLFRGDLRVTAPAWPVPVVVDTVGSGDCFQGALLASFARDGLLEGRGFLRAPEATLGRALDRARVAAALNVGRPGASPPTADEVDKELAG